MKTVNPHQDLLSLEPFRLKDLVGEEWRAIEGCDEFYQVSNLGRVKSLKREKACFLKPNLVNGGYLVVRLQINGQQQNYLVHRLVAKAFTPNPENKPEVNHIDGNKLNNHAENLEWATRSENIRHAYTTGLTSSKLTEAQVMYIRSVYKPRSKDFGAKPLSLAFGVSKSTIQSVVRGRNFKTAGGKIHDPACVPENVREEIRRLYVKGSREFNTYTLAKQFGLGQTTVMRIVNEN